MKHSIKQFLYAVLTTTLLSTSCAKKLDEAYENPNAPKRVPVETLLPSAIGSLVGSSAAAGSAYGIANDALFIGRYIQYWGTYIVNTAANVGTQYDQMGGTTGSSDNLGSMWGAHYFGLGQNVNRMIEWADEEKKWDFAGAGCAIRAWSLLETTNEYGDMILKQAYNVDLVTFLYDTQPEVYDSARAYCYRALNYFNAPGGNNGQKFAEADAYFNGGSIDRWKKFTCGILARSFAYIHNKATYSADSVIKYTNLAMTTNADNATCKFANTGITGTSNFYGSLRVNVNQLNTGIRQAAYIADLMSGLNAGAFTGAPDPRRPYMLRENANDTYKGIVPGKAASTLPANDQPQSFVGTAFSTTGYPTNCPGLECGRYIFRNAAEFPIMTASEMQFLKSEALLRKGGNTADALTAYVNGITLNFEHLATKYQDFVPVNLRFTPGTQATYLANAAVVPTAANLSLTHVMLQKYIALYGWGVQETWADMRRYHYNVDKDPIKNTVVYAGFTPPSGTDLFSNNGGKLVQRARPRYNSEYLYNIPELTRIGALGLDYHTKEMWFSSK
jgi:hypothetical protein